MLRVVKHGLLVLLLPLMQACDESLPPRIHPLDIDPEEFLSESSSSESGVVRYERGVTVTQSLAGTQFMEIKNLHDEVLSGREDITINVEYWFEDFPGDTIKVVGDRNNLLNPFNFQGEVFMLDGDILTIHPDSSARFRIQFDHTAEALWNYGNPVYIMDSCGFPPCGQRVVTDQIRMSVRASIRLFENQRIPLMTEETQLTIWYFFVVSSLASAKVLEFGGSVDSNGAALSWTMTEQSRVHHYDVERSLAPTDGFVNIGTIMPQGSFVDTVEYSFTETNPSSGTWYYRVGLAEEFLLVGPIYVESIGSALLIVP